jgi:ATP-dependent Clp protease ATP-binding subunit ClpC
VLSNAQEEAEKAGHAYIGTEHVLLGLLSESDGLAAKALLALGIRGDAVRAMIEQVVGRNEPRQGVKIIPTESVKRAIELAFGEAQMANSEFVDTEHVLLGLMGAATSIAPHVLTDLGADEAKVRAEIKRLGG